MTQVLPDYIPGHYCMHFAQFVPQKKVLVEMKEHRQTKVKLVLMKRKLRMIYLEKMVVSHN